MGLDYSYKLFFPRTQLANVINAVTALARVNPGEPPLTDSLAHDWPVCLSLYFEFDEAIKRYVAEWREDFTKTKGYEEWEPPVDAQGRVAIGCIYLTIYQDLNIYSRKDYDPNLVMLSFTAATTDMSLLFERSKSIRDTFALLLLLNEGDYGLLDRENDAVVIAWRGQILSQVIPDSWLPKHEIESIVSV